jgi:hypothetical protein
MSSVEREEERSGGWRAGREEPRMREGRGRERYNHDAEGEGGEVGKEREASESTTHSVREAASPGHAPLNRGTRAFSFLSNLVGKRARPALNLGGQSGSSGSGPRAVGDIGRKRSGIFESESPTLDLPT